MTNTNPGLIFQTADARVMTSRVQARLNALAASYYRQFAASITVLRAWSEFSVNDSIGDPNSLHYEGNMCGKVVQFRREREREELLDPAAWLPPSHPHALCMSALGAPQENPV